MYKLKEATLASALASALGLERGVSCDAKKLEGWRGVEGGVHTGNFPNVVEDVCRRWVCACVLCFLLRQMLGCILVIRLV